MGEQENRDGKILPFSHRPRKKSEQRQKGCITSVRTTAEERAELEAAALAAGLTLSSYIRESLLKLARQTQSRRRPLVDVAALAPTHRTLSGLANNFNQMTRLARAGIWPHAALLEEAVMEIRELLEPVRRAMGVKG